MSPLDQYLFTTKAGTLTASVNVEPTTLVGAAPLGTTAYVVPGGAIFVSTGGRDTNAGTATSPKATLAGALAAAPAGGTIVLRGGVYKDSGLRPTRAVSIQAYPGETVWFDGTGTTQWFVIVKAAVQWLGLGFRAYPNTGVFERGFIIPDGGDGTGLENCHIYDMADLGLNVFQAKNVRIVHNTIQRSGTCHIGSDRLTDCAIEDNVLIDCNTTGQPMQPTTSAMKHTRAQRMSVHRNLIQGGPKVGGVWLDESCRDVSIVSNDILGCEYEQIQAEASERVLIAGNYGRGLNGSTYNVRVFDTGNARVWNNDVDGGRNYQIAVMQDARRNTDATLLADGVQWVTRNTEVVNNQLGPNYHYFQLGTEDLETGRTGEQMLSRVEGNAFPAGVAGAGSPVGWARADKSRTGWTVAQAEAGFPAIMHGNNPAAPAVIPDDIADLMRIPRGSRGTGLMRPRLIAAS